MHDKIAPMKGQTNGEKWPQVVRVGNVTVKIYKTSNRDRVLYQVVYRDKTGKRHRQSSACVEKAKSIARQTATELQRGVHQALKLSGSERLAYERAARMLEDSGKTVDAIAAEYMEATKILDARGTILEAAQFFMRHAGDELVSCTVPALAARYLEQKKADGCSERHMEDLHSRLGRFSEAFEDEIEIISTTDIQNWLNELKVAGRTKNNYRRQVVALFKFAQAQGHLIKGEDTAADGVSKARDTGGEIEIFSVASMTTLLESAEDDYIRLYIALGAFTGLRSAELKRLDWSEIDTEGGYIEVKATKSKTAQRRLVPIQPNLKKWLKPLVKSKGSVFVHKTINHMVSEFAREQGIEWVKNGLRHSYASYRLADCHDAPKVALEMGNSPQIIFRNYRELVPPAEAKKWWGI